MNNARPNHPGRINQLKENSNNVFENLSESEIESAVLVGVLLPDSEANDETLEELEGLAETAEVRVVGRLTQRRETPDMTTYLGKGKVDELKALAEMHDADMVIFDNDLNPGQTRNLEKALDVKVIDRTELILDIFAKRAQTRQARLAVELAQLEYAMPRLKRMWTHLSRQKKGVGTRGPGETQLEEDRRLAENKILDLKSQLKEIERRKEREVTSRRDAPAVSLVGYTNAGKSTLMNAMTGSDVFVQDALFATLDTRTRRWHLPGWGPILLSDTVGFIRNLPHHLIESFKATLEEARRADLLLHVADASNPSVYEQISATYKALEEIAIERKDTILVFNKIDALEDRSRIDGLLNRYPHAVPISARTGKGLRELAAAVSDALSRNFMDVDVRLRVEDGKTLAFLAAKGEVLSKKYAEDSVVVHCRIAAHDMAKVEHACLSVERRGTSSANVEGEPSQTSFAFDAE